MKKSDNSYDEHDHRKELDTKGMNMPKEKVFINQSASKLKKTSHQRNSLSKEEISYSAPELEVGREYREEGVIKETPGSQTSKTIEQCNKLVEEDAKYIVPKMDVTYSLREEEADLLQQQKPAASSDEERLAAGISTIGLQTKRLSGAQRMSCKVIKKEQTLAFSIDPESHKALANSNFKAFWGLRRIIFWTLKEEKKHPKNEGSSSKSSSQ
jgi:hypothetical protein